MVATGVDSKVAKEAGYVVRTAHDGRQYVTLKNAARVAAQPDTGSGDYLTGSCGYSFIYFNGIGHSQGAVYTGYGLIRPARELHWVVDVHDSRGVGIITTPADTLYTEYWSTQYLTNNHNGHASAQVSAGSYVIMNNGVICHSLEPEDETTIY